MAHYSAIKAAVNAYIKQNGRKEITGRILNAVLNATIDSLGRYFQFAGGALPTDDPGTPDQNVCYLAGEPGVYTNFGGITIENEEVALLFWDGEWTKQRILIGIREVNASVDNQVGTPSVDVSYSGGELVLTFHNLKGEQGETGDPAGFGTIGADINGGVGTPGVSVETSGDNTAKNLMFHFTNLKGETGVTSVVATIDNTSGTPSCQVSLVGQQLTLAFSGLKGLKGDTGVSADYPITIYNGLDSDATDQALAAYQGKVLDGKIGQLEAKIDGSDVEEEGFYLVDPNYKVGLKFHDGELTVPTKYNGKKFSFLGDSITTFGVPDQNNATGTWTYPGNRCRYPQNDLLVDVNKCWWMRLLTKFGATLGINESWAGSRVSNTSATDTGDVGPNRCISSLTRIGHLDDNGTPDVIIVYAGANDIGNGVTIGTFDTTSPKDLTEAQIASLDVTTFANAYRAMLIRLQYYYKTSRIVVCFPNFTNTYYDMANLDDYIEVIREECDYFGVEYIDLRASGITIYNRTTYLPDGTHPNALGMELLFNKVYNYLMSN